MSLLIYQLISDEELKYSPSIDLSEIYDFHSGDNWDCGLQGYDAMVTNSLENITAYILMTECHNPEEHTSQY
jgi:hypothetical protein